jgi:hypothetical protein
MSGAPLTHLLLTRFNLNYGGVYDARYSEDWMRHRMAIFARYCLPSVARQSASGFRWLVFFDRARSEPWRAEIGRLAALGPFEPVYLDGADGLVAAIAGRARDSGPLVTSRLDNDDAVHNAYIADIRTAAEAGLAARLPTPFVLDFRQAVWWDIARGEIKEFPHREVTPYASLVELVSPAAPPRTVFAASHNRLDRTFGAPRLIDGRRVLTLVHDRNVVNGIRRNRWTERVWLRVRNGHRYRTGEDAARILAEFGIEETVAAGAEP